MKTNNRFVFDTNVLVSAFILKSKTNAFAFDKALDTGDIISTAFINMEITDVFSRQKFDKYVSLEKRLQLLDSLQIQLLLWPSNLINPLRACRDPKDNMYLELAVSCRASCIVTGDKDLLVLNPFRNIPVITPSEFLKF